MRTLDPLLSRALFIGLLTVLGSLVAFTRIPSVLAVVYAFILTMLVGARAWRSRAGLVASVLVLAVALSSLEDGIVWTGDPDRMAGTLHWLSWLVIGLALPQVLTTERRWDAATTVLVGVAVLDAMVALVEPLWSAPGASWLLVRRYALTANPGFFGVIAMVGTIIAASRVRGDRRTLWAAVTLLCLFGVLSSGTRTAMLGLLTAGMVLPIPHRGRWVLGSLVTAGVLIGGLALGTERMDDRTYAFRGAVATPLGHGFYDYYRDLSEEVSIGASTALPSMSLPTPSVGVFRSTPGPATTEGEPLIVAYADFPHNMLLQLGWDLGLLGLGLVGLFGYGLTRLRGVWLALGLAFTVYSLFWIPSPGWFAMLALLVGRMIYRIGEKG